MTQINADERDEEKKKRQRLIHRCHRSTQMKKKKQRIHPQMTQINADEEKETELV
jgi:hypothetical protein